MSSEAKPQTQPKTYSLAALLFVSVATAATGMVAGICFGAYLMYLAYIGLSAPVRDNIAAGMVIHEARGTVGPAAEPQETPDSEDNAAMGAEVSEP